MLSSKKTKSLVGLDIEAGSVAATEVRVNSSAQVLRTGIAQLEPGAFNEGEVTNPEALAETLREVFASNKLSKDVRLGIANQRAVMRTMRLPLIEKPDELRTAIRFQAQDEIPMPLDQSVFDFQVVSKSTNEDGARQMDVAVVAARREMVSSFVDAVRKAGLRPVGIDLSAFGMVRALVTETEDQPVPEAPATLYCSIGDVTILAVARGSGCLFTRVAPFGFEEIAQRLAERRELTFDHARQWLSHVGLQAEAEQVDGDPETVTAAREVLVEGASKLNDELRRTLEFYGSQEGMPAVERVALCGPGSTTPGLAAHLEQGLGRPLEVIRPQALSHLDDAAAARLTVSYGLGLEG